MGKFFGILRHSIAALLVLGASVVFSAEQEFNNKLATEWKPILKVKNLEIFEKWVNDSRELISTFAVTIAPSERKRLLDFQFSEIEWQKIRGEYLKDYSLTNYQIQKSMKLQHAKFKELQLVASKINLNKSDVLQFVEKRFVTEDKLFIVVYTKFDKSLPDLKAVNKLLENIEPIYSASRFPASAETAPAGAAAVRRARVMRSSVAEGKFLTFEEEQAERARQSDSCSQVPASDRLAKDEVITAESTAIEVEKTGCVKNHTSKIIEAYKEFLASTGPKTQTLEAITKPWIKAVSSAAGMATRQVGSQVMMGDINPSISAGMSAGLAPSTQLGTPLVPTADQKKIEIQSLTPEMAAALYLTFSSCYNSRGVVEKGEKNCKSTPKKQLYSFADVVHIGDDASIASFNQHALSGIVDYTMIKRPLLRCGNMKYRVDMICAAANKIRPTTLAKFGAEIPINSADEDALDEEIRNRASYVRRVGGVPAVSWSNPTVAGAMGGYGQAGVGVGPGSSSGSGSSASGAARGISGSTGASSGLGGKISGNSGNYASNGTSGSSSLGSGNGSSSREPANFSTGSGGSEGGSSGRFSNRERFPIQDDNVNSRAQALGALYIPPNQQLIPNPSGLATNSAPSAQAAAQSLKEQTENAKLNAQKTAEEDKNLKNDVEALIQGNGANPEANKAYDSLYQQLVAKNFPNPNQLFIKFFNTCYKDVSSGAFYNQEMSSGMDDAIIQCMSSKISIFKPARPRTR